MSTFFKYTRDVQSENDYKTPIFDTISRILYIFPALEPGSLNVKKRLLAASGRDEGEEDGYQVAIILFSHTAHYPPPPPHPPPIVCLPQRVFLTSRKT
jgi:hypothetical protein